MKKVLIFTCIGGHNTISESLVDSMNGTFNVQSKNIFTDVLRSIDPFRLLSCGLINSDKFYSFLLRRHWYSFLNRSYMDGNESYLNGCTYFNIRSKKITSLIRTFIVNAQPDCIISVIPFFNNYFLAIAQELDIPFILMPTDIDITNFVYHMKKPITYKKFHFAIALDHHSIHHKIKDWLLPKEQIHVTGVALKPAFFQKHDPERIKRKFNIPQGKPVILLLMGSQGSCTMQHFAKTLTSLKNIDCHLIMVLGAHADQKNKIDKIIFPSNITYTIFGFTQYVAELMSISSLLITKSGGISISEALYANLPCILDATSNILIWEKMNQLFMQEHRFGTSLYHLEELPAMVEAFLTKHQAILEKYKTNMQEWPKINGADEIKKLVVKLLN